MRDLPEDVISSLVRGFGAYIRDTPSQELPASLRRLARFRTQSLLAHREQVLEALEDEAMRALVVQWLQDRKRSLSKEDVRVLRLFCERPSGWEEELRALARPPRVRGARASTEGGITLERERARARKAKQDARRAKEAVTRALETERARAAELEAHVQRLEVELAVARREAVSARAQHGSELQRHERELRKARRAVERAQAERDDVKTRLREERRRADALARKIDEVERSRVVPSPRAVPATTRVARQRRRASLPVPPGRPGNDPETLDEWLDAPRVHLLVDGYNVTLAEGGFGDLTLEAQRSRLVQEVGRLVRRKGARATVVFDGSEIPPGTARRYRSRYVRVEYSRPPLIADDHLVAVLEDLPLDPVVVVTNDRELQARASRLGATIARSTQLLALIR
jgi:predicted RNA-binding protein with PIN domain